MITNLRMVRMELFEALVVSVHRLGRQLLCGRLVATTASYIAAVFSPVLSLASSRDPDTFLAARVCRVRELVRTRSQVSEELLVHAVLAWLEADWEDRGQWTAELMEHCNLRLVLCSAPSVPQPVVQSRRRPLLGPSPG